MIFLQTGQSTVNLLRLSLVKKGPLKKIEKICGVKPLMRGGGYGTYWVEKKDKDEMKPKLVSYITLIASFQHPPLISSDIHLRVVL